MRKLKVYSPGLLWTLLIFVLSSMPAQSLHLPSFWDLFSLDKLAHAVFYAILFIAWSYSIRKSGYITTSRDKIVLLVLCMTYGGLLELFQGYCLANRTADYVDELANSIGAFSGYLYWQRKKI